MGFNVGGIFFWIKILESKVQHNLISILRALHLGELSDVAPKFVKKYWELSKHLA